MSVAKKFIIKSTNVEKKHKVPLTKWCNGLSRIELKDKALSDFPKSLFNKKMNSIDMKLVKEEKNLQGLMSYDSYRKVRSEKLNENRADKDDLTDLKKNRDMTIKNKEEEYIHEILDPFAVYLYSKSQFMVLKKEIKKRDADFEVVMHMDATGAVVRKLTEGCNQIYYYVGIIKRKSANENDNHDLFPVFEMISSSHDVVAIGNWLRTTKERLAVTEHWLDRVVSDMSFATINSLCDIFNHMSFVEYLNMTHLWMNNQNMFKAEKGRKTIISLCSSHLMKNLTRDIKSSFKQERQAKHIIEIFSSLFNIPSYEIMKNVWSKLCVLLLSSTFTTSVEKTLNYLVLTVTAEYKYNEKEINVEISEENELKNKQFEINNHKSLYENSPFYKDFYGILEKTNSEHTIEIKKNDYFNPQCLDMLLKKYVTYLSLWSGALNHLGKRNSNAPVECYFSQIKHEIAVNRLKYGSKRLRCSDFINLLENYIRDMFKIHMNEIPKCRL